MTVLIGVASGLLASIVFLFFLRTFLHPKLELSEKLAHGLSQAGHEIYRVKIVNARRTVEAVKLQFDLVTLTPVSTPTAHVEGRRSWFFFGARREIKINPHKYERAALSFRPVTLISLPRRKLTDPEANYAVRVTTRDCEELGAALAHMSRFVRMRVYAEHPWSGRGRTFERTYSTAADAAYGDFPVGPSCEVVHDLAVQDAVLALQAEADPGQSQHLVIIEAVYGHGEIRSNVTGAVRLHVVNNRLEIPVTNQVLCDGADPVEGQEKTLTIKFSVGGMEQVGQWTEKDTAVLP